MTGKIFDIKKFAVHDGDGIRTTVFFKGCPLKCVWCHNPEGISFKGELQYVKSKCINCGECVEACEYGAHTIDELTHKFNRTRCVACGKCAERCLGEALIYCGREMTADEVVKVVLEDREFYISSGGGVTLSGGECLCQADFCAELLKKLKEYEINCNVDTCGYVDRTAIDKVAPYTDVFLYDIKHIDSKMHQKYTGVPNEKIIENLKYINSLGKKIEVRIPLIPGINDDAETINKIGRLLSGIDMLVKVRVLPYNNLAGSKYKILGIENTMPKENPPSREKLYEIVRILESYGLNAVTTGKDK